MYEDQIYINTCSVDSVPVYK